MSLPTRARFLMKGEMIATGFANIGWHYDETQIPRVFYEMMCERQFPKAYTWDEVELYEKTYKYNDVMRMLNEYARTPK